LGTDLKHTKLCLPYLHDDPRKASHVKIKHSVTYVKLYKN